MKFLILGDIFPSAIKLLENKLPKIIKKLKIDFIIANGENASIDANGITPNVAKKLFNCGVDVITSGNHIWDKNEILNYIDSEKRLLRPFNMKDHLPGLGINIYEKKKKKICVVNLMTNYFMPKTRNVFGITKLIIKKYKLKKNCDYIIVDVHGEFAGEKMAIGHILDGKATVVVGTHTHIPTLDAMILPKGTAYQTDLGMCGDYDSVIGLNKKIFIERILKVNLKKNNLPASKNPTICGSLVNANSKNGLAKSINQIIIKTNFNRNILKF